MQGCHLYIAVTGVVRRNRDYGTENGPVLKSPQVLVPESDAARVQAQTNRLGAAPREAQRYLQTTRDRRTLPLPATAPTLQPGG